VLNRSECEGAVPAGTTTSATVRGSACANRNEDAGAREIPRRAPVLLGDRGCFRGDIHHHERGVAYRLAGIVLSGGY
jgi:hypothetical protein